MNNFMRVLSLVAIVPWLVACGDRSDPAKARLAKDPGILSDDLNQISVASIQGVRDGKTVYRHTCGYCHEYGVGPAILGRDLPADGTAYIARNGLNSMPGFRETDLSDEEVAAVVDYIASTDSFEGYQK